MVTIGSGLVLIETMRRFSISKAIFTPNAFGAIAQDRELNEVGHCKIVSPSPQPSPKVGEGARVRFPFS